MRPALIALPLVLVAACGGSSDNGLSKSDYLNKAEAICAKANTTIDKTPTPSSAAALPSYVKRVVDVADKATSDLEALDPPKDDKDALKKKVLTPLRSQVTEGKAYLAKVEAAVKKNDQAALGKLISNPPTGAEADLAWMRSYGFKQCVTAADTSS